jgi:hypothetical protein
MTMYGIGNGGISIAASLKRFFTRRFPEFSALNMV